ncbi:BEL1-like homeodomain protein 7 [Nymphaea colorata]|nr:BEL1-like homeodomain protein 7 [Nymphaea colorata]XP_031495373.1 BEL1-like homeodomain protein 7 [Nymphaea colorata]XP_049936464.1 BEL1-like homeodomain protein 7 [Nymphaea colorata]
MATYYFPGSSVQREVMPAPYVKDTGHCLYPEAPLPGSMAYMNFSSANTYSESMDHPQSPQSCVEVPISDPMLSSADISQPGALSNLVTSRLGNNVFNGSRDSRNEMLMQTRVTLNSMQDTDRRMNCGNDLINRNSMSADVGMQMQLGILQGGQNLPLQQSAVSAVHGQGLSLSLGTRVPSAIPLSPFQYPQDNPGVPVIGSCPSGLGAEPQNGDISGSKQSSGNKYPPVNLLNNFQPPDMTKSMHMNPSSCGFSNVAGAIPSSKYLKAAQQLLEEVVNVRKVLKPENNKKQNFQMPIGRAGSKEMDAGINASENPSSAGVLPESTTGPSSELSQAERQELQSKLTKLSTMLDEVDRRYKQYYHQLQVVVSSFDAIVGCGAAKTYTALAFQTISSHFRCLRDAISGQICACRRSLGEQDASNENSGLSRLRFVDQQLRQQRALQQLGMIHQHAWRPQRGLPESSVSVLRAWLFEHFLHPYPKDSDKLMLAQKTGLTRSQVSNWFINARVRLWKPMVEEMYKEEIGETELDSNSSSENAAKEGESKGDSEERESRDSRQVAAEKYHASQNDRTKSDPITDSRMANKAEIDVKDSGNCRNMKSIGQCSSVDGYHLRQDALFHSGTGERIISFQMAGLERFGTDAYTSKACASNDVSLTLGLQHCDVGLPVSSERQNFMAIGAENSYPTSISTTAIEYMNMGNRQQQFGTSNMLHDFVS